MLLGMNSASSAGIVGVLSDVVLLQLPHLEQMLSIMLLPKNQSNHLLPLQLDWLRKDLEGIVEEHFSIFPKEQPSIQKLAHHAWIILTSIHLLFFFSDSSGILTKLLLLLAG